MPKIFVPILTKQKIIFKMQKLRNTIRKNLVLNV